SLLHFLGRPATFWLYAVIGILAWFFVYRLVPETKGRTWKKLTRVGTLSAKTTNSAFSQIA
ncbi:MAG: MFS transporter, partial [Acidobacteriaceae bacterium]